MKSIVLLAVTLFVTVLSAQANATRCEFLEAKIVDIHEWYDGHIFIKFNKTDPNCPCVTNVRLAFHKDDNEDFFTSASLAALLSGATVDARGVDSEDCSIHGNTQRLDLLRVYAQ